MSRFGFGFGFGASFGSGGGGVPLLITRNFTTLDSAFTMHYAIPTHTSSSDFTHTAEFAHVDMITNAVVFSGGVASVSESFLRLSPADGSIDLIVNGGVFLAGSAGAYTVDTKLHKISLSRIGDDYSIKIDEVEVQTFNQTADNFVVEQIGIRASLGFESFDGVLANVNLDGVRKYNIDETWIGPSTVLVDTENGINGTAVNIDTDDSKLFTQEGIDWLGVELLNSAPIAVGTNGSNTVTNITANSFDLIGDGTTFFYAEYPLTMNIGVSYKFMADSINNTGEAKVQSNVANELFGVIGSSGEHTFVAVADGVALRIARRTGGQALNVEITNTSLKRILQGTP